MRWTEEKPRIGDKRTMQFFAIFPVSIERGGVKETRWLETVCVLQQLVGIPYIGVTWEDVKFVEVE